MSFSEGHRDLTGAVIDPTGSIAGGRPYRLLPLSREKVSAAVRLMMLGQSLTNISGLKKGRRVPRPGRESRLM